MAIRSEIRDRFKRKPTSHLEVGLERFSSLQLYLLDRVQELMRGANSNQGEKLLQLIAVIDPKPQVGVGEGARGLICLGRGSNNSGTTAHEPYHRMRMRKGRPRQAATGIEGDT